MNHKSQLIKTMAQPWAIRAASMAVIIDSTCGNDAMAFIDLEKIEKKEPCAYTVEDGLATIQVSGVIGKKLPKWMAAFGMVDVDDVCKAVVAANADTAIKSILLDIDSPGGSVTGVPEAGNTIRESAKPIYAYSDTLCASAAYWLASGASGIFASESALVGSIGVFVPIVDMRKMYEMAGIEMDVIKSGSLKAAGYPGTSLTAAQRADLQASVDFVYSKFTGFVCSRESANGKPQSESMQGQDFYGDQAVYAALVDGICSREQIIKTIKNLQNY